MHQKLCKCDEIRPICKERPKGESESESEMYLFDPYKKCIQSNNETILDQGKRHFFLGTHIRLGTILGRFSIIYFRGLGLRIRVRGWVRVRARARVRVWVRVRVRVGVWVRVSIVLWSW